MKFVTENRHARFEYEILESFEAGIVLTGDEIKSVRSGHMSLNDCYGFIKDGECFLRNSYIKDYDNSFSSGRLGDNSKRDRKLLLHKDEILKLKKRLEQDNLTLVPLNAYFDKSNLKVTLALVRGKKLYDKRETIKERDILRRNKQF